MNQLYVVLAFAAGGTLAVACATGGPPDLYYGVPEGGTFPSSGSGGGAGSGAGGPSAAARGGAVAWSGTRSASGTAGTSGSTSAGSSAGAARLGSPTGVPITCHHGRPALTGSC